MKKLPIGTKILRDGKEHTILAYSGDGSFVVDNWECGHDASGYDWLDENGKYIPYIKGKDDRWWIAVEQLSTFSTVVNEEPEFIFSI